jgi:hypothetical protein
MNSSWTPLTIVLTAANLVLALVVFIILIIQSNWIALLAIGVLGAVLWALYHQGVVTLLERPSLQIMPFELEPPLFRKSPEFHPTTSQRVGSGFYVNVELRNMGETLAKSCQPVVTAMGKFDAGKWQKQEDWIPLTLEWVLDELSRHVSGKPTEERDLIPHKPYNFNLGCVSTTDPHAFRLLVTIVPSAQQARFTRGQYCFEITVFAEKAKPATKYFHVKWAGECTDNFEEVKTKIRVFAENDPPW